MCKAQILSHITTYGLNLITNIIDNLCVQNPFATLVDVNQLGAGRDKPRPRPLVNKRLVESGELGTSLSLPQVTKIRNIHISVSNMKCEV